MSLYNALFGQNALSDVYAAMAGVDLAKVGRFRDCYISNDNGPTEVYVFTRNGGGNRESYEEQINYMQSLPTYQRDYDDDFDSTYATFVFKVLPEYEQRLKDMEMTSGSPMEKFQKLLTDMQNGVQNDQTKRALEIGKQVMEKIKAGGVTEI